MKIIEKKLIHAIIGGQETQTKINEMQRETAINRTKSASKIHNKLVQVLMS